MKNILLFTLILTVLFLSCNMDREKNGFKLQLVEDNPYVLKINNFYWHKEEGKNVIGDFLTLDKEVCNLLHDKTGICEVYIKHNSDYDNSNNYYDYVGFLTLTADKPDWHVFNESGGIRYMIKRNLRSAPVVDTTVKMIDTTSNQILVDTLKH